MTCHLMRRLLLAMSLVAVGCSHRDVDALGTPASASVVGSYCMTPDGGTTGWREGKCEPPAKIVAVPICTNGQIPLPETPELVRARLRGSMDGTLVGDAFHGSPYCIPLPPS